jgi:hypothetical protein
MAKQSLTSRAQMAAIGPYKTMVSEIPNNLLAKPCSMAYYGCGALPSVLDSRRAYNNIDTTPDNLLVFESNEVYNSYASSLYSVFTKCYVGVKDYDETYDFDFDPKYAVRVVPFQVPGQGKANVYHKLLEQELQHDYEWTADILPSSWQRSNAGDAKRVRDMMLNQMGLYKIVVLPFDIFADFGMRNDTAIYFCKKGYTGEITVEYYNDPTVSYSHDFRNEPFIVTPKSKQALEFLLRSGKSEDKYEIKNINGKLWKQVELNDKEDKEYKHPVVVRLKKTEQQCQLKYSKTIFDNDYDKHRVAVAYLATGYYQGDKHFGNVVHIKPGKQLGMSYKYITFDNEEEAIFARDYLDSKLTKWINHYWRTSRTCDPPQWKGIPKVDATQDVFKELDIMHLKEEILQDLLQKSG